MCGHSSSRRTAYIPISKWECNSYLSAPNIKKGVCRGDIQQKERD
nr:MAG TPA: hypothetical protein [Caudoviricetes sp.]